MNLHHPEATHLFDGILPLKQTPRGIFRLDSTGEWCRSNIAPDELKYVAKKVEDLNTPDEPKKPKRDQYLDKLNRLFSEVKTVLAQQKKTTINGMADELNTSPLTIRRCMLMIKKKLNSRRGLRPTTSPFKYKAESSALSLTTQKPEQPTATPEAQQKCF